MRLEAISLHGFKSFAEKTVVKILPGITGVVGPNGTGKSNISEAVRWALGEQSAKSLRGQRMEDLIFHGSQSRKPVGLAEVELTFTNDGEIAIPFSEVSVSRRLYRDGESEYLLNGISCRLRDILDLFAGTGANPRAYSVMDQEKLNHVLTAKPHERRIFIEEAAGIARYKQQRGETQTKLEATRQNLVRVRDVMDEVKRQLASLERQAKRARQYKALQSEKRELALTLTAADYAALMSAAGDVEAELGRLRADEEVLRARIAALSAREALHRETIQRSEHRLSDLRQSVHKVQGELERLLERREQMGLQLRESADEAARLEEEIRQATERRHAILSEREESRRALDEVEALAAERAEAARALEETVERHRAGLTADRDRLEALRLEQVRLAAERTDLMRNAGELRERAIQLQRRGERLATELGQTEAEAQRLAEERAALETGRQRVLSEISALTVERETLETALDESERQLAEVTGRLAELRVELAARRSSLESLRELERVREGYGAGVRAVFAEGPAAGLAGVVGTVADLLEVPPSLERAIEAALGERLEWVVVERYHDARAAVMFLAERGLGSATFLPLEHLGQSRSGSSHGNGSHSDEAGAAGGASNEVSADHGRLRWVAEAVEAPVANLVHHLLGPVALADDLDHAEALWRQNGVVATYVTPAGEVLTSGGRLRGGAMVDGMEHSLLGRKRKLRELETEVERLEGAMGELQTRGGALESQTSMLRARVPVVRQAVATSEAVRLAGEKDLEQWEREHERVDRHRETIALESGQVSAEAAETRALLDRLDRRIAAARDSEAGHDAAMGGLRDAIERSQEREAKLVADLTAHRVEAASAAERVEALGRELGRLDQIEAELTERIDQARGRHAQALERGTRLAEERGRTDTAAREVAAERDRVEGEARAAAARHEELTAELRAIEGEAHAAEGELRALTSSIHEQDLRATENRVRREELVQETKRTWSIDEGELRARFDPSEDVEALRARVTELEAKLEAFGGVNLVADEEYRELDERLTFLATQHDDLMASVKNLEKALRGMTRAAQERFTHAFEEINRHFGRLFERLFEGGRAELRLVAPEEGDDPLDTGIELMAQPRGKRLQSVTLLSSGERALTGLALLFAIFYYRPSPFCVLDEVDAPLDDANIFRFLRVLRELTSQTQFVVITHNRKTMESADILYGVTMEEPGLSRLVSVNLNA